MTKRSPVPCYVALPRKNNDFIGIKGKNEHISGMKNRSMERTTSLSSIEYFHSEKMNTASLIYPNAINKVE